MWKNLTSKTIYIQPGNLVLSCCRIKLLYFQKGGFMFKDIQLNCANFSTEMINDTDLESLKKSFLYLIENEKNIREKIHIYLREARKQRRELLYELHK